METCKYRKQPEELQKLMKENLKNGTTGPIAIAGSQENKPVCLLALDNPLMTDGFFDCVHPNNTDQNCPIVEWLIK